MFEGVSARWSLCLPAFAALLLAPACSKESASGSAPAVEALPKQEIERGRTACQAYVDRVCACARNHADMADECALSKARPEAFEINIELARASGLSKIELQAVKVEARKIVAACFEDEGRLDAEKCPRAPR